MEPLERCSVVVVPRDRFSPTARCLDTLISNTDPSHELIAVVAGASEKIKQDLAQRFASKIRFVFRPEFLNPAQSRNIALREVNTRLAILMDNDVQVRPGWLAPLVRCQIETGAAMVVPVILEGERKIHTAGNDLFISYKNGKAYGRKELRFLHMFHDGATNLKRVPTDYGELHCQLVEVETALRLGVYDENIQEVGEVDAGLTWQTAGCKMFFEPSSTVIYDIPKRILHAEDIRFFAWRWDMRKILEGHRYFEKKWNMDISDQGTFAEFLFVVNNKLGLLPRLFPSRFTIWMDWVLATMADWLGKPFRGWRRLKGYFWGAGEWAKEYKK